MRIEIDINVADIADAHMWLDRILHKICDGWHVWDTTNLPDPGAFEATTWITDSKRTGDTVRELLVESIKRNAWGLEPHKRFVRVTSRPTAADEMKPEDAARLAEEPLRIIVENRHSDGAFVKRVVKELDKPLYRLWERKGEPVKIDSLGGHGQMEKEVKCSTQGPRIARG